MNAKALISLIDGNVGHSLAVVDGERRIDYATLSEDCRRMDHGLKEAGLKPGERVAIHAHSSYETIVALFGTASAGGVFIPVNRMLKPAQVQHIFADCEPRFFLANHEVLQRFLPQLSAHHHELTSICLDTKTPKTTSDIGDQNWSSWRTSRVSDQTRVGSGENLCAIVYTSGSTGMPKGIMLSHNNLIVGANSVNEYLGTIASDRLIAALPFSFDAGLSQLTTAFAAGASVICHNYLLPQDLLTELRRETATGLTAVPSLWSQLCSLRDAQPVESLRYFANTGGALAPALRESLETLFPNAEPYLMYGFTEAFRGTYLEPSQVNSRPTSIGRAIPGARIDVVTANGRTAEIDEPGELVQSGPHVAMGYWNNPMATAKKFRPLPAGLNPPTTDLRSAWSGDIVRRDADGYLFFIGRADEMIKTSGYRVSPEEIESVARESGYVDQVAALGLPDEALGARIVLLYSPASTIDAAESKIRAHLARELPRYMLPRHIVMLSNFPLNANGKPDRITLREIVNEKLVDSDL
ncbi:MAG: AMP-binding protein [Pseudomonadota bacterium]